MWTWGGVESIGLNWIGWGWWRIRGRCPKTGSVDLCCKFGTENKEAKPHANRPSQGSLLKQLWFAG